MSVCVVWCLFVMHMPYPNCSKYQHETYFVFFFLSPLLDNLPSLDTNQYIMPVYHFSPKKEDRHTKGGRGSRPAARDGKRTHDRRSGTGRGREVKKGGGGGRNWGSDQNDARKAEGPVTEGKEDANTPESEEAAEKEEEAVEEKEPEPEEITMSYDEYMAQKAKPDSEAFKALESREVDNEFAGKAAAKKEEADFLVMGGGKGLRKKGAGKKEKEKLVLDFKVKSAIR